MASLSQIRSALQATIEAADPELTGYAQVPEQVNLPAFVIIPRDVDFNGAMGRGHDAYTFDVIVLVSRRDDGLAQVDLDDYISGAGPKSIRQAVFQNQSLGLVGTQGHVSRADRYGASFDIGGTEHVGAVLVCQVITPGNA